VLSFELSAIHIILAIAKEGIPLKEARTTTPLKTNEEMNCFGCRMLTRKNGLRNFCELKKKQLSIKELKESCKHFLK